MSKVWRWGRDAGRYHNTSHRILVAAKRWARVGHLLQPKIFARCVLNPRLNRGKAVRCIRLNLRLEGDHCRAPDNRRDQPDNVDHCRTDPRAGALIAIQRTSGCQRNSLDPTETARWFGRATGPNRIGSAVGSLRRRHGVIRRCVGQLKEGRTLFGQPSIWRGVSSTLARFSE